MYQYLIDVTIVWTALYLIYHFYLQRVIFFELNRIYLNASLLLGVTLPFLRFVELPMPSHQVITLTSSALIVPEGIHFTSPELQEKSFDFFFLAQSAYMLIATILLVGLGVQVYKIFRLFMGKQKIHFFRKQIWI